MNKLVFLQHKDFPYIAVFALFIVYAGIFTLYHNAAGVGIAALAAVPVIVAGWYFGIMGGVFTALLSVLSNIGILIAAGHFATINFVSDIAGFFSLVLIGIVVGLLGTTMRERNEALNKLEKIEADHQAHTNFLEILNDITGMALKSTSLNSTVSLLIERIAKLFEADDAFFAFWDADHSIPIPRAAYGSMSDLYPYMQFEPGERTPTTAVIESGNPLTIEDLDNSPYIDSKIASVFPSRSMLALPLLVRGHALGALLLGYNNHRSFEEIDLIQAEVTAEQVALVLAKSLALEEEHKRVKQLTALHDISLLSIEVDNEDELINRVTDIIGQNLFTDNFGILLLDEESEMLKAHPSYRFFSTEYRHMLDMPLDKGVTGTVARTGKALRIGNVRRIQEYFDVDDRTVSELCVPIKFKEQILGVINAESTQRDAFTEDDERLLITLAGQIATAMEQIRKAQAERKWLDQLAHSNDLIYALAQITTHIEKAFDTGDIIRNLGTELGKIDLTCIIAIYDKERGQFTINYTSMEPRFLEIVENGLGHPLIKYTFAA